MKLDSLTINICARCNFKCIACPQAYHLGHYDNPDLKTYEFSELEKGCISIRTIKRLFYFLDKENIEVDTCGLDWNGESMMHPKFLSILKLILKLNNSRIKHFILSTNAYFLNKRFNTRMAYIINRYRTPFTIIFSLDAIHQDTYTEIKRNPADISVIYSNVKDFIRKAGKITTVVKMLVLKENLKEANVFKDYWEKFFKSEGMKYCVIFSDSERKEGINRYILFSRVSPYPYGESIWKEFMKVIKK